MKFLSSRHQPIEAKADFPSGYQQKRGNFCSHSLKRFITVYIHKNQRHIKNLKTLTGPLLIIFYHIQHPDEIIQGFQLNLLQKIHKQGRTHPARKLPSILTGLLARANRPFLAEHILRLGLKQWKITGQRLLPWNRLLGFAFYSAAALLASYETTRDL